MTSKTPQRNHEVNVFEELGLARKINKKAEGTQTHRNDGGDFVVSGEMPDENVVSIIEMLRPCIQPLRLNQTSEGKEIIQGFHECEVEEISVDRSKKIFSKDNNTFELKEVFEELCLSRKRTRSIQRQKNPPQRMEETLMVAGEVPDQEVSEMINMLTPSLRQLYSNKECVLKGTEKNEYSISKRIENKVLSNSKEIEYRELSNNKEKTRSWSSEPIHLTKQHEGTFNTGNKQSISSAESSINNSIVTAPLKEELIKDMLSPSAEWIKEMERKDNAYTSPPAKELVTTGCNTEMLKKKSKRYRIKKRKGKVITEKFIEIKSGNSEKLGDPINNKLLNENPENSNQNKPNKELTVEAETAETIVNKDFTVHKNKTEWTEITYLAQAPNQCTEELTSNIESEPSRGCPNTFQYKIQFKNSSCHTQNELKHFKALLLKGKTSEEKEGCEIIKESDCECLNSLNNPLAYKNEFFTFNMNLEHKCSDCRLSDEVELESYSSFNTTSSSSDTTISSVSCCSLDHVEKMSSVSCICQKMPSIPAYSQSEPKVYWAITKINVYPDNTRTYEVMPLTGKKPAELPDKSDSVFVLIPPKKQVSMTQSVANV